MCAYKSKKDQDKHTENELILPAKEAINMEKNCPNFALISKEMPASTNTIIFHTTGITSENKGA